MHIMVIGGGAAGMAAAIAAAQLRQRVTVVDRNRKMLKKLGVTGNGRGNLLNCGKPEFYGDETFALEVLHRMPYERTAAFLTDCGIPLVQEDEGRMYPSSFLAASAVDALRWRAESLGVELLSNIRITSIEPGFVLRGLRSVYAEDTQRKSGKAKPGALLREEEVSFRCDRVITAAGGAAAPMHGTDGTAYELLTGLGHRLIDPKPALCALTTEKKPLEGLAGQRVKAALALRAADGNMLHQCEGEALFAEDGVSGIAAMQLSRHVQPGCTLHMDLRRAVCGDADCDARLWLVQRAKRYADARNLLLGAAPPALVWALWRMAGCSPSLEECSLSALAEAIRNFHLAVEGTRGFESAQVTAGGLDTAQFDSSTMESRLIPGLYAAGEMLNVDGGCGGFNLMFAFAGGLLAGQMSSKE